MTKVLSSIVLDAAATVIRDNAAKISICSAAPSEMTGSTGIAEVNTTAGSMLAVTSLTTGASTSFTIADSSVSGRKITISQQASIAVEATGVASHVVLFSSVSSVIYGYTTCATQALTDTANKVTIPAFIVRFAEAT